MICGPVVAVGTVALAERRREPLVAHLAEPEPDVLVLEMGDGLLGTYGVRALLGDPALCAATRSVVLCAQDPVGAWGAKELLAERYGLGVDVISGRVTDGPTGLRFCRDTLGVPAWNALRDGKGLSEAVLASLERATPPAPLPVQEVVS